MKPSPRISQNKRNQLSYRTPYSRNEQQYRAESMRPFPQNYHQRHKKIPLSASVLMIVFAAAIGLIGWISLQSMEGTFPAVDADTRSHSMQSTSTPKSEWKQGSIPLLFQTDPAWASTRYAENNFGESGCGPTCLAMVYTALTGATDKDPASMASFATENGYASSEGTAWSFMTDGAGALGLSVEELPAEESRIRKSIVAGRPVICSMGPGDFTSIGHFIVLANIDQNGNLVVRDPNSPERSAKTWSFDTVLSQSRNIWSYSLV